MHRAAAALETPSCFTEHELHPLRRGAGNGTHPSRPPCPVLLCVPDKNQDNLELAEERFKEIQNAYEILIDPHERAW